MDAVKKLTRRGFLKGAGAGLLVLPSARSAFGFPANDRLNLAIVGVGGYAAATQFVPGFHQFGNVGVTALCDVNEARVPAVWKTWEEKARGKDGEIYGRHLKDRPKFFADYRKMLDEMGDKIDAVVVATPDHSHAVISGACLRAGKHVFAEKPLTINVRESRALREVAVATKTATSMGNQGTQSPQFRRGVELVREGVLGPIEEVHLWFSRGGQNHQERPQGEMPVPEGLHWDLWLGPVAARPYHPRWIARCHWRETGAGELGNFGPHTGNLPFMALNLRDLWTAGGTIRVKAEYSELNRLSFPKWEVMQWKAPARGSMAPVTVFWHHAPVPGLPPGSRERLGQLLRDHGVPKEREEAIFKGPGAIMVGKKGILVTSSHNTDIALFPEDRFRDLDLKKPASLPTSRGHYQDWIHACRGGPAPWSNFVHATTFCEFLMLGPVATQLDRELEYDPVAGKVVNSPEADRLLGTEYRAGFKL
jgi:GFO/IDH/MocA oxidoreductase family protein